MSYFLFNGVSSEELGLIVTEPVIRPSWEELVNEVTVPGALSKLTQRLGTYDNELMTIQTAIPDADRETLDRIYGTLHGPGKLQLSTAPEEYLNVYIRKLEPRAVAQMMGELPVTMTVSPFAYAVEPTVVTIPPVAGYYEYVPNPGTAPSEPLIEVTGSGEMYVNTNGKNLRVELPAELGTRTVYLDCAVSVAYYEDNGEKIPVTQYTYGEFPLLAPGTNWMLNYGGVTGCTVTVRERWY